MNPKFAGLAEAASKLNFNLGLRSEKVLARISAASVRADAAFDKVDATLDATEKAAADIEEFASSLEGSNGGPLIDSSAPAEPQPEPERLSVNGVAQG